MTGILVAILVVGLLVGFVVFFGPPYLPTMSRNIDAALDLLDLQPGQTVLDLGSGDGRVLVAAAKRGMMVVGIELSPIWVVISWLVTRRYRRQVRIIWGNYFAIKWPPADAIFTFMIPRHMAKLDSHIDRWRQGNPVRLASFAFKIPAKKPTAQKDGVFLYEYR